MKLCEIASVRTGLVLSRKQPTTPDVITIEYKQLNLKCITADGEIDILLLDVFQSIENLKWQYLTHSGDVLVRLSNPYTAVLITDETEGIVIPSHFVTIRADEKYILPEYLYWLLNTEEIKKDILQNNSGSTLGTIRPKYFADFEIKPLSIEKQRQVADINLLGIRELQLLEELKQQKEIYYKELTKYTQKQIRREK